MDDLADLAEEFGQRESLCSRLKNIISLYPEGPGVLFELIQNADDAKATQVNLILNKVIKYLMNTLDFETTDRLTQSVESSGFLWMQPRVRAVDGPVAGPGAVCPQQFYFHASGSKLDKINATGRFGLGFNATYHFTDIPSFVSSDSIVFFDPHAKFVPGATGSPLLPFSLPLLNAKKSNISIYLERNPGIKIPLSRLVSKYEKYKVPVDT
eukprot:48890-Amorphochlora_amoeboformis.AAC.2